MVANGREDDVLNHPYFSTITKWKDQMLGEVSIA